MSATCPIEFFEESILIMMGFFFFVFLVKEDESFGVIYQGSAWKVGNAGRLASAMVCAEWLDI